MIHQFKTKISPLKEHIRQLPRNKTRYFMNLRSIIITKRRLWEN